MTNFLEGKHNGEFIVSEANGSLSRDNVTIQSGLNVTACTVLGIITATGVAVPVAPAANDGSQTAAAILIRNVNATAGAKVAAAIVREAEVRTSDLNFGTLNAGQIATVRQQLAALKIICRDAI